MNAITKVGITAWADVSLLASGWYPCGVRDAASRLRWYATQFAVVENDSTYYALPEPRQAQLWVDRTPPGFTMNVKAFASLTEHYTDPARLPRELRSRLSEPLRSKRRVYPRELGDELLSEIAVRFRASLEPLRQTGRSCPSERAPEGLGPPEEGDCGRDSMRASRHRAVLCASRAAA